MGKYEPVQTIKTTLAADYAGVVSNAKLIYVTITECKNYVDALRNAKVKQQQTFGGTSTHNVLTFVDKSILNVKIK